VKEVLVAFILLRNIYWNIEVMVIVCRAGLAVLP